MKPLKKIAIFGGGIGGLTVAHELGERAFDITLYERSSECGGKAKSLTTKEGYPAEHSIRTIGLTYYHFRDTLKRIPSVDNKTVLDHVKPTRGGSRKYLIFTEHDQCILPAYFPFSPFGLKEYFSFFYQMSKLVPIREIFDFIFKILKSASMCPSRAMDTLDKMSWDEYIGSENKSRNFKYYLHRLPEFYVAAKGSSNARSMSMLINRSLFLPIMHPFKSHYSSLDVFDKPTSEALIDPWVNYLNKLNIKMNFQCEVIDIILKGDHVDHVLINDNGTVKEIVADIYVFAVPVEVMQILVEKNPELSSKAASLRNLNKLSTEESSGLQLYFEESFINKFPPGWAAFLDSPWSLLGLYHEGGSYSIAPLKSTLTLTWSNFDEPGVLGKPARECTAEEMKNEIIAQIKQSKNLGYISDLKLNSWYVDHEIEFAQNNGPMIKHHAPLFIQLPDSLQYQPNAKTEIDNLFLAADYVKTLYDLATMETANEAGRRAANEILKFTQSKAKTCYVRTRLRTGFGFFQLIDYFLYKIQKLFTQKS